MPSRIVVPGRTVWRLEQARRAAVLVDAAAFFSAVRQACLKARRRIIIVGWDIDSRTPLVGDRRPDDSLPVDFRDFLVGLVARRPELQVDLLLWDYSLLYAHEREPLPRLSLQWQTPPQVTLCLDASVPFGSSQHQKIVVIDDALAFSGGLDITIRRWDTSRHDAAEPRRVDPAGERYRPFHDVQMMVDGPAAAALALLARTRWCNARGGVPAIEPSGDPWPDGIRPDFDHVEVGVARTQPRYGDEPEIQEVRSLFLASIARAQRFIYIENQFITSAAIADGLARQLRRRPRGGHRGAAQPRFVHGAAHHAQWAHPLLAHPAQGRRPACTAALSSRRRRRGGDRHHDPFQGHGDRRLVPARRVGESQQPLDGGRHRMRPGRRGR